MSAGVATVNGVKKGELDRLVEELGAVTSEARAVFGALTPAQLNWKPSAERWSVGQCFDHLIQTNRCFFPEMERVAAGTFESSLWARVSPFSGLIGRLIIDSLDPVKGRKTKSARVFLPASSDVAPDVMERFASHQEELVRRMRATAGRDLRRTMVTSPVTAVATYSLLDAYRIIVGHERKHFEQARRVTEEAGFPRA
ncbi:MAG TPA: DinB family protein [Pyrinomonadaceae bacterium]|jgi:hypothetical protein|nr:DinB family protein [Pyrinomonadaceae bacterium]